MSLRLLPYTMVIVVATRAAAQDKPAPTYYYNPGWSADGRTLLFESTREGKYAIYTLGVDGTNLKKLTAGTANDEQPKWSHDGRHVTFISDRDGHYQIYLMNSDGSSQVRLTNSTGSDIVPAFSPDDQSITYSEQDAAGGSSAFVMRADGSGGRRLTDSTMDVGQIFWSRTAGQLLFTLGRAMAYPPRGSTREVVQAFMKARDATQDVGVVRPDGTRLRLLTQNDVRDCCARWSADGRTVYFASSRDSTPGIYAMDPDGSNLRRLTNGTAVWPNGAQGLYVRSTRDGPAAIYTVDLKGANAHRIADATMVPDVLPSPDGHRLAYTRNGPGDAGLYVYDLATGSEHAVISGPAHTP